MLIQVLRQHLIWIASIIKNGISLIISSSEYSINHKGPLNHVADGDDGKLMLRNYAKRHTSWSGLKAQAHKLCSCFIYLPSLWACTLKATLVPARPNWKQCHVFTKAHCALNKKWDNTECGESQFKEPEKVRISVWCAPEAFKHPALWGIYTLKQWTTADASSTNSYPLWHLWLVIMEPMFLKHCQILIQDLLLICIFIIRTWEF